MTQQSLLLPYTICFCKAGNKVLMLFRERPPNQHLWNGVGGKIEEGETPENSVVREVSEETGINVERALSKKYAGIVTWTAVKDSANVDKGMYAYIIEFPPEVADETLQEISEGKLEWKDIQWVVDKNNNEVVENIPFFLPEMLEGSEPNRFHCEYENGILKDVKVSPISENSEVNERFSGMKIS